MPYQFFYCSSLFLTDIMSTEEKIPLITGCISDSEKDLGQEKAEGTTLDDETEQSDLTTIEQKKEKHTSLRLLVHSEECQFTLDSCKVQEVRVEKDCDNASVSTIENRENVKDESASNIFQGHDPVKKQEKFHVPSTTLAETKEENCGTEIASKITDEELKNQGNGKHTTEPSEDSKKLENEKENDLYPTEEAKDLEIGGQLDPDSTTAGKEETGNSAKTSGDVKKQERRRWFRFLRPSKEYKFPKSEEQKITEAKKEEKHYDIRHVYVGGSYLLVVGLMFVCVAIILGGFFWRIGYAIGGYHEDILNATACPTLTPSSNDSSTTHHSVLKVLQKMWRNESDELVSD